MSSKQKKTGKKESNPKVTFLKFLLLAVVLGLLIKGFVIDAYRISSNSMMNTLKQDDFIFINKASYRFKTPETIPFTNLPIPNFKIFSWGKPKRDDVVIFKLNKFQIDSSLTEIDFVKRIVALPGESIRMKERYIYVDELQVDNPHRAIYNLNSPFFYNHAEKNFFPFNNKNWSLENYGPVRVPQMGDTISLNPKNIAIWQPLINSEMGGKYLSVEGTVITLRGKPIRDYVVKKNYYFVLGDNRYESIDSRFFGFVPEDAIIGKAWFIYWSINTDIETGFWDFFNALRFDRILRGIN